ncbi:MULTISPECIES: hypothetical protein [unclassified Anabaena]|uniref:hypothetical protein n=1 Tax=unclassified Anabaena TaxID=2619674 RepID=UPI00083660AF|nr:MULTISPECIES: hypothetical protein [unclassified Anabaena]
MANITVDQLHLTGYDLFQDFETFLNDLTHQTIDLIAGGGYSGFFGFGGYTFYSNGSYNSFPRAYPVTYGYGYGYGYGYKKGYYC